MSGDFRGSIAHTNEFYLTIHGDYIRTLKMDKSQAILLGVLEVAHDSTVRSYLRTEQRGRTKRPQVKRVEDIPPDALWFSLSLSDMRRRSIEMCSESMLQRAIPYLEARGFLETRFVRLDEHGRIIRVYPCIGQNEEKRVMRVIRKGRNENEVQEQEHLTTRLVNLYDWHGEDARLVVRTCLKQYRLRPEAINQALRTAINPEPPDGTDDPAYDNDADYFDDETSGDGQAANQDSKFTNHATDEQDSTFTNHSNDLATVDKCTNQDSKFTMPPMVNLPTDDSKTTDMDSKFTEFHAHSNKGNNYKNLSKKGNKGTASPSLTTTHTTFPDLPEHGELTPAAIYQILAHYLGLPQPKDEGRWNEAAISIHRQLEQAGLLEIAPPCVQPYTARMALIRTILYMKLADKFWSTRPGALSAWKIAQYFTEYLHKSATWQPAPDCAYAVDLLPPEERCERTSQVPTPAPAEQACHTAIEQSLIIYVESSPLPAAAVACEPVIGASASQHPADADSTAYADTEEEAFCDDCGLPRHYARPLARILELGYGIRQNDDGTFAITARDGVPLDGFDAVPARQLAFSVPLALLRRGPAHQRSA